MHDFGLGYRRSVNLLAQVANGMLPHHSVCLMTRRFWKQMRWVVYRRHGEREVRMCLTRLGERITRGDRPVWDDDARRLQAEYELPPPMRRP
jgi:hypothetical protein